MTEFNIAGSKPILYPGAGGADSIYAKQRSDV